MANPSQAISAFGSITEAADEENSDQDVDMSDSVSGVVIMGEPVQRQQTSLFSDFREQPAAKARPQPDEVPLIPPADDERPMPPRPDGASIATIARDGQVMLGRLQRNQTMDHPMARQAYTLMVRVNDTDQLGEAEQEAMITLYTQATVQGQALSA